MAKERLIFATHDACELSSIYRCTPALFRETVRFAIDFGTRIPPMSLAIKHPNH
jgi:hypothetical protein